VISTVYIIIISHNGRKVVSRLLDSVYGSTYTSHRVILVDNNSKDGTTEIVKKRFPECNVINNRVNFGYGPACNIGIKKAIDDCAEFLLILNQDTTIHEDMISNLVKSAEERPSAGVIGPKTYFLGPSINESRRILYSGAWRRVLPLVQNVGAMGRRDQGRYDRCAKVDYVWGHGMFMRTSALKEVGFFDPDLFMYYEDLDLCLRMQRAGYEIWYEPAAVMWHDIPDGARASQSELWRWKHKSKSISLLHRKYYGSVPGFFLDMITMLIEVFVLAKSGHLKAVGHRILAWIMTALKLKNGPHGGQQNY
jgi:GT2 family glycosyltransferase